MEARHPAGYDRESFRHAAADTIRIPRRPYKSSMPHTSQRPSHSNDNSSYGAQSTALAPNQPLGRSSRDRMASPSYASLVNYPGIDESIRKLTHLAKYISDRPKPSKEFLDTVNTLSTSFIEHVAAERGAIQKKSLAKHLPPSHREKSSARGTRSRKRRRTNVQDSSDSSDSAPRKKSRSSRPRRNIAPVRYSDQDDDRVDLLHTSTEQRSILPRRSKQNISNMHEDILAAKSIPPTGRSIDVESEHRSNNSQKPPVAFQADSNDDISDSESEDSWIMPMVRPLPYVRDRPLVSDRTSLTPVIMDDDVDTDAEERKIAEQKQRLLLEARERRTMELMRRARSFQQSTGVGTAPPFQTSQPHGVRLCADSVVIPIRGTNFSTSQRHVPDQCYKVINIPPSAILLRDLPRLYKRSPQDVLNAWKDSMWRLDQLGQAIQDQKALQRPGSRTPYELETFRSNQGNMWTTQAWNEISQRRGPGSAVRILPRVGHAADGIQPNLCNTSQQITPSAVTAVPTSMRDVGLVSSHQGIPPNVVDPNMAMPYGSELQQTSMQGVGAPHMRNGVFQGTSMGGAAMQNETSVPNIGVREKHPNINSNGYTHGGAPQPWPGGFQGGGEKRIVRSQAAGRIDSTLGTMGVQQIARKPNGPHSQRSARKSTDLINPLSLPSPVTPDRAQGFRGAVFNGFPQNHAVIRHSEHGRVFGQDGAQAMRMNEMPGTVQVTGQPFIGNGVPCAEGLVNCEGREGADAQDARRHVQLPTSLRGAVGSGVGSGLGAGQMNSIMPAQHLMMNRHNVANLHGQHRAPHHLIQSAALHDSSHGVSANIYQAVYEETYRRTFAERQRQMAEERRRAERN